MHDETAVLERPGASPSRKNRSRSLQWVLVRRLIFLQAASLVIFMVLLSLALFIASPRLLDDNEAIIAVVSEALDRDAQGRLIVRPNEELDALSASFPDLWFVVHDAEGKTLRRGNVPEAYAQAGGDFWGTVASAVLRSSKDDRRPWAAVGNVDSKAGKVQIVAATAPSPGEIDGLQIYIDFNISPSRNADGSIAWHKVAPALPIALFIPLLPIVIVMGFSTLVTTPAVVRRALAGLVATARQAGEIDIDNRAVQLSADKVPLEVAPLVQAFNHALSRLGQGYDRNNRYLTDAAHELRTPIAILRTRAELLDKDQLGARLVKDIERLSRLTQQLLDRQLVDRPGGSRETVDLMPFARQVAADFAPLAIAAGYEFSFEPAAGSVLVSIVPSQIEQALANLLRNAIDHGGGQGTITLAVEASGAIEVRDEGPGIPEDEREKVFEPFYRLHPGGNGGAGLGLNLARQIARQHGGCIDILDGRWGGARIRLQLPLSA